jgi:hypothetical protein
MLTFNFLFGIILIIVVLSTTVERGSTESGQRITTTVVHSTDSSTESGIRVHIETLSFPAEEIRLQTTKHDKHE